MRYKCKVCNGKLFSEPILILKNMPAGAQLFGNNYGLTYKKGVNLKIFQCSMCGLVQLTCKPVPYYKEVIRASAYSKEMKSFRLKQFRNFLEKYNLTGKKIIEIGCGKGEFLELMKETGADVHGIEYGDESVKFCRSKGLKVEKDYIKSENHELKFSPFNGFFILNFLEHIPNINNFLKGIVNNLVEDGIGLVEVPNFNMIVEKKLFSEFIRDHLFYFTKDTLKKTLEINGFEVIESNVIWYDYIISVVVRKRKKINLSSFTAFQENLKIELNRFIDKFGYKKVAIWGAGHQALAVISLTGIGKKIKYIIDSAEFKQGKYTPVSHIPIVPPEILDKNEINAIIVMAGSYSDEVIEIIRQNYERIKLGVLRNNCLEIIEN